MELFNKLVAYVEEQNRAQLHRTLLIFLAGVVVCAGLLIYQIYSKQSELLNTIKQLKNLSKNTVKIIEDNRRMIKAEQRLKELLEKNLGFTMKGFFEQFCREQEINADPGWDTRTETINDKFDEITLTAVFKGQTTEKLVKVLTALEQKEIVYIKELTLRNENNSKITFTLTLGTKQNKVNVE